MNVKLPTCLSLQVDLVALMRHTSSTQVASIGGQGALMQKWSCGHNGGCHDNRISNESGLAAYAGFKPASTLPILKVLVPGADDRNKYRLIGSNRSLAGLFSPRS